jgi:hypothetical protein
MLAALVVVLAVVTLAPGGVDPQYLVRGSPFDSRGYSGILLVANQVGSAVALLAVMVAAGSLAARFRRARGVEHQQLRWVALAALVAALASVAVLASLAIGVPGAPDLFGLAAGVCLAVVPVAIGAAILRYRLYDLDRIISRTLAYGLLTVLLGGSYAGVVLGLGQLPGRSSSPVVAAATLAVAGMLQPARRRIQQAVDRRFNRRRYHVAQTIAAFSARLRDQVDLDTMTADLVAVVEETMQPTQGSLWLRPPQAPRPQFEPSRPGSARGMMQHERGPAPGVNARSAFTTLVIAIAPSALRSEQPYRRHTPLDKHRSIPGRPRRDPRSAAQRPHELRAHPGAKGRERGVRRHRLPVPEPLIPAPSVGFTRSDAPPPPSGLAAAETATPAQPSPAMITVHRCLPLGGKRSRGTAV